MKKRIKFVVCVIVIIVAVIFFEKALTYWVLSDNVKYVVETAEKVGWNDDLVARYNEALGERLDFVEVSIVGKLLYNLAASFWGQLARVVIIMVALMVFAYSIAYCCSRIKRVCKRLYKKRKRRQ